MAGSRFDWAAEIRGAFSAAALAAVVLLAAGYLPDVSRYFDLLSHFRVHLGLALIGIAVVLLIFNARIRAMLSAGVAIAAGVSLAMPLYASAGLVRDGETDLTLLSFNMLYVNEEPERVVSLLETQKTDVAFILEAPKLYPYLERLKSTYPYQSGCEMERWCDLLVLSRHPFESLRRPGPGQPWDRIVAARISPGGRPVDLVALHLSKPYEDGAQWHQFRTASDYVGKLTGPVILAGDFNATPWSLGIREFAADNGLKMVSGYRPSWPARFGPLGFPIDHVMVRGVVPTDIRLLDETYGSNHRGIVTTFDLPD